MHLPPIVATFIVVIGIAGLFWLDRDPEVRTSKALWIPTAWLLITCSRPVSMWLGMTPSAAQAYVEGSPVDAAVYMALLAAGLVVVYLRREQVGPILRENWPIVLFFSYAAVSILWSDFPFVTFKHWIKGISDVAMVLIVLTEPDVMDAVKRLGTRVGFVLLPLSVLFIKYYPALGRSLSRSWTLNYGGVTTGKNELGWICLLFGLGLLWRFRNAYNDRENPQRRGRLMALGTVLGMTAWLLWMCNSMTSTCGLAMAGAVMLLAVRPAFIRRPSAVHLLAAMMLSISLFALFLDRSTLTMLGRDATLTGRTEIWRVVLSIPVNRWVGAGYESFWLGDRLQGVGVWSGINEAHNGCLEILLTLGWVGVALLALLIVTGYRNAIRAHRDDADFGGLKLAFLLAVLNASLTEAGFRMLSPTWFFFLLATMAVPEKFALREDSLADLAEFESYVDHPLGVGLGEGSL